MKSIKIVQISDLHCGSNKFDEVLMEHTIEQVNEIDPDLLVVTGDLTMYGYLEEYEIILRYLENMNVKRKMILPGNHDSRNVGYRTFEELIGNPFQTITFHDEIIICGVDSTQPDLDDGQLGRSHTMRLKEQFSKNYVCKILALHHHLISVPNCGREMDILRDAGDVLKMAVKTNVNLTISGHKHIPYLWRFEGIKILTCSTTTSRRFRGIYKPSYNIITIDGKLKIEKKEVMGNPSIIYEGPY